MKEPRWLNRRGVFLLHSESLAEHGGSTGIRDEGLLDTALTRPVNKWNHNPKANLAELAAAYGFGLARNHAFVDGNKRIAFIATTLFLRLNGLSLSCEPIEEILTMLSLAAGELPEEKFADWIRKNSRPSR
jgi:death on curing protein